MLIFADFYHFHQINLELPIHTHLNIQQQEYLHFLLLIQDSRFHVQMIINNYYNNSHSKLMLFRHTQIIQQMKEKESHFSCKKSFAQNCRSLRQDQENSLIQRTQNCSDDPYFQRMNNIRCEDLATMQNKLQASNVKVKNVFNSTFEKIFQRSGNVYTFTISYGFFQTEVSLLKINMNSNFVSRRLFSRGNFAKIFLKKFKKQNYAIKSQEISRQNFGIFDENFDLILLEYFGYKIASILEFGPKLENLFGFDLICFEDSLQFSMQFCPTPPSQQLHKWGNYQSDLLIGLKKMHTLQIVHRDIKNKNISWSQKFKKWIFLDFGFISFLQQSPGFKTYTSFRGTYNFSSKQMQDLYHLKKLGYINLYSNDIYGLDVAKKYPRFDIIEIDFVQKDSTFEDIILLSKMQFSIYSHLLTSIKQIFEQNSILSNQFLGLLVGNIEKINLVASKQKSEIFCLYQELKKNVKVVNDNETGSLQRGKVYKILIKQNEENFKSIFLYTKQKRLREKIQEEWGSFNFMKQAFLFFHSIIANNSSCHKYSWRRMKLVINIISELFMIQNKRKNWFWKLHQIIICFEEKFIQTKQYHHLQQILLYYYIFKDKTREKKLKCLLAEANINDKERVIYLFNSFYQQILSFRQIEILNNSFQKLKKQIQNINRTQEEYHLLFEISERILDFMEKKSVNIQKIIQFDRLLQKIPQSLHEDTFFLNTMLNNINNWKNKFFFMFTRTQSLRRERKGQVQVLSIRRSCKLSKIIIKLFSMQEKNSNYNLMVPFLDAFPICKQISNLCNFRYNLGIKNYEKINEICQNIFEFNKENIEEISDQLTFILSRWKSLDNQKQQIQFIFTSFLFSYKKNLSENKLRSFWNFFSRILLNSQFLRQKLEPTLRSRIIQCLEFIATFFSPKDLARYNQIYLHLFVSLKMLLQERVITVDHFLKKIEQNSLTVSLKNNQPELLFFIEYFVFCELMTKEYFFHKTQLFQQILNSRMIYWIYIKVPLFLRYILIIKAIQHKQGQAVNILKKFTNYLLKLGKSMENLSNIFHIFLKKSAQFQRTKHLLFHLLNFETFSSLRKNEYISAFIFEAYYKLQRKREIPRDQVKKIYISSIANIDNYPNEDRVKIQKLLKSKFRFLEEKLKRRKKRILDHQEDYARGGTLFLKKQFMKKVEKTQKVLKIKIQFETKIQKVQKNMDKQFTNLTDLNFIKLSDGSQ